MAKNKDNVLKLLSLNRSWKSREKRSISVCNFQEDVPYFIWCNFQIALGQKKQIPENANHLDSFPDGYIKNFGKWY